MKAQQRLIGEFLYFGGLGAHFSGHQNGILIFHMKIIVNTLNAEYSLSKVLHLRATLVEKKILFLKFLSFQSVFE